MAQLCLVGDALKHIQQLAGHITSPSSSSLGQRVESPQGRPYNFH